MDGEFDSPPSPPEEAEQCSSILPPQAALFHNRKSLLKPYKLRIVPGTDHFDRFIFITMVILAFTGCSGGEKSITVKIPDMDLLTAIDTENVLVITQHMDAGTHPDYVPIPTGLPFEGAHPLHLAVLKRNTEILQILLDNGANINIVAKNSDKAAPLSWAAFFLAEEAAAFLVKSGADINLIDANGLTPLDSANLAWRLSQADTEKVATAERIIKLLKDNGALTAEILRGK